MFLENVIYMIICMVTDLNFKKQTVLQFWVLKPVPKNHPTAGYPQVSGGCDFVRKTVHAFMPETVSTTIMVDLLGYDGFPALAALEVP